MARLLQPLFFILSSGRNQTLKQKNIMFLAYLSPIQIELHQKCTEKPKNI
jgi:hypothetical protein